MFEIIILCVRKSSLCHRFYTNIRRVSSCMHWMHDLICTRGSLCSFSGQGAGCCCHHHAGHRADRWCVPFLEAIKDALHAIKHAWAHPFLIGFKRGTSEHGAVNLCSQSLCHMKWTSFQVPQVWKVNLWSYCTATPLLLAPEGVFYPKSCKAK